MKACTTEKKLSKTFVSFQALLTLCHLFQLKCNVCLKSLDINPNENINYLYFLFKLFIFIIHFDLLGLLFIRLQNLILYLPTLLWKYSLQK